MMNLECRIREIKSRDRITDCQHSKFGVLNSTLGARGQAMVEYIIIAGLLAASLGILTLFFTTFKEYGLRILALVSSEYP